MEMDFATMIQAIGFPTVAVIGLGIFAKDFINKAMVDSNERELRLIEANNKLSDALQVVADTTESATVQLNRLCDRMDNLEDKIDAFEQELRNNK